ncbi:hypothetical protein [Streptomyces sp. NPDC003456]|uniref:hypothetical protein n=1 Tax=Streptomyces sp. NPDC003456 TaxID=3364683 RepID=UPI0036BDC244
MTATAQERGAEQRLEVRIATDPAHGGRWTSLTAGGREWRWHRKDPRRAGAAPGHPFTDAGGLEECVPTVRGRPDHGDAWSRSWHTGDGEEYVDCPGFRLSRRIGSDGPTALVDYRLSADPGHELRRRLRVEATRHHRTPHKEEATRGTR